jgi:hypothetical protein
LASGNPGRGSEAIDVPVRCVSASENQEMVNLLRSLKSLQSGAAS